MFTRMNRGAFIFWVDGGSFSSVINLVFSDEGFFLVCVLVMSLRAPRVVGNEAFSGGVMLLQYGAEGPSALL